jgi:hypothetical protein
MKKLVWLLAGLVVVTIAFGTVYLVAQQILRSSANDPQIQMAEDIAVQLNAGVNTAVYSAVKVDIAASLSPFIMIYDSNGQLVTSGAQLYGQNPVLPPGVLTNTKPGQQNRLTWQPAPGVRIATIVTSYNKGYVLAGRSLREVEKRETITLYQVLAGWLIAMGGLLLLAGLTKIAAKRG